MNRRTSAVRRRIKSLSKRLRRLRQRAVRRSARRLKRFLSPFRAIAKAVAIPFQYLSKRCRRWVKRVQRRVESSPRYRAAKQRLRRFSASFTKQQTKVITKVDQVEKPAKSVVRWFRRPTKILTEFGASWWKSRRFAHLVPAIPSLLIMLGLTVCFVLILLQLRNPTDRIQRYRLARVNALLKSDTATVELCQRKLAQLGATRLDEAIMEALALCEAGERQQAYEILKRLVDQDASLWQAHYLLGQVLQRGQVDVAEAQRSAEIEMHLNKAAELEPRNYTIAQAQAEWLRQTGRPEEARRVLDEVRPIALPHEDRLQLALKYLRLGFPDPAREIATGILTDFAIVREPDLKLTADNFLAIAGAKELLGRYEEAFAALNEAARREQADADSSPPRADALDGGSETEKADKNKAAERAEKLCLLLRKRPGVDPPTWLRCARLALDIVPRGEQIHRLLAAATTDPEIGEQARALLESLIPGGSVSHSSLELLADASISAGQWEHARHDHLRLFELDPDKVAVVNNLAYLYSTHEPIDLERALEMAQRAVELEGSNPAVRETRGQILLKMEHWTEAIDDLEFAVNGLPHLVAIHESLAICYQHIGNDQLATAHRERALHLQ